MKSFIYGMHAIEAALKKSPHNFLQIFLQQVRKDKRTQKILQLAKKYNIHVDFV